MKDYERNLQRFSDMDDVEVAEDDPDVRGWDVVTRDGHDIGEVKDLLVDTRSMKVRCLEIELEGSHFKWNDNRRVAIPVESVQLDEEHDDVVIDGMGLDEIGRLDEYRPAGLSTGASYAGGARPGGAVFDTGRGGAASGPNSAGSRERLTRSEEEKRPVVKEELVISKERVSDTQNVEADLRKERLDVEKKGRVLDTANELRKGKSDEDLRNGRS